MTEIARKPAIAGGQDTETLEWMSEDEETHGLTVPLTDSTGRHYRVTGWMPEVLWLKRQGELRAILQTIELADTPRPKPTVRQLGPLRRYEFGNKFAVSNGPRAAYTIKFDRPVLVRTLRTYHWNRGRGVAPGTLALKSRDGVVFGPWAARGEPGQGGVPNAYWRTDPGIELKPGVYTIVTSNDRTWSTNTEAGGRGFFTIEWQDVLNDEDTDDIAIAPAPDSAPDNSTGKITATDKSPQTPDTGAKPSKTTPTDMSDVLFAGDLGDRWSKLSVAGGDFDKFAHLKDRVLEVSVPEGSGWGKTGLFSKTPLVAFPKMGQPPRTLTWSFDPQRSTSFVVALGARADADEWAAHEIRVMWTRDATGTTATLALHLRQQLAMSAVVPPEAPDRLTMTLSPDGSIRIALAQGQSVEAVAPPDMLQKSLHVYALAHPREAHGAAKLALRSIVAADAPSPSPGTGDIFSGQLGATWQALSSAGGDFNRFARLGTDGLIVDVPKDSGWGKTGLYSRTRPLKPMLSEKDISVETLHFALDPERTTSFVIAAGSKDGPDEWSAHDFRFAWSRSADGTSGLASATLQQQPSGEVVTGPEAPSSFDIIVRGDGVATLLLPGGARLEVFVPDAFSKEGLRLYVLAHAPGANNPAKLALQRISYTRTQVPRTPPLLSYPDTRTSLVLFDGIMGTTWGPFSAEGGDFNKHARLSETGLTIAVPAGSSWGKAGLTSREPLVWLRSFTDPAEATIDVTIDPAVTDGFRLSLVGPTSFPASAYFQWQRKADGSGAIAEFDVSDREAPEAWRAELPEDAPRTIRFHLKPGSVAIAMDGTERAVLPWAGARDGVGFKILAHAAAVEANAPVRFGLKRITLAATQGPPAENPRPAAGVLPLPVRSLFSGKSDAAWTSVGLSGVEFATYSKIDGGKLTIDIPADKFSWGRAGLLSDTPVANLDERVERTPMRLTFKVDPEKTTGLSVVFSYEKVSEMWPRRTSAVSLIRAEDGPNMGYYLLQVHGNPGTFTVPIDPAWIKRSWTGTLEILLGRDWVGARLDHGPLVRVDGARPADYILVTSHPQHERGGSRLVLESISRDWIMPHGMSAADRWTLLDSSDFDADGFWNELAGATPHAQSHKQDAGTP